MLVTTLFGLIGFAMGVIIAAPIGPVNIMCIQRTLRTGFWGGFAAGLGAVLGDGVLAAAAAFGVNAISSVFETHQAQIQIFGGMILIGFGIRLFFQPPVMIEASNKFSELSSNIDAIPQTFLLTVANPGSLFALLTLFGGLASWFGGFNATNAFVLVLALMAGSTAWWCVLSWLTSVIRRHLNNGRLSLINQGAAAVLVCFGVALLGKMLWRYLA